MTGLQEMLGSHSGCDAVVQPDCTYAVTRSTEEHRRNRSCQITEGLLAPAETALDEEAVDPVTLDNGAEVVAALGELGGIHKNDRIATFRSLGLGTVDHLGIDGIVDVVQCETKQPRWGVAQGACCAIRHVVERLYGGHHRRTGVVTGPQRGITIEDP